MLQAYVDDSANTDPPIFVLAGCAATVDQWSTFSEQWDHALRGMHLKAFKMSEANQWSFERKQLILPYLYRVICNNVKFGFHVIVDPVALKKELSGLFDINVSTPYYFCFFRTLIKILSRDELPGGEDKIEFIFDEQRGEEKYIRQAWDDFFDCAPIKAKQRLIAQPQFRTDDELLPLQAADFRSWWTRHNLSEAIKGNFESDIIMKADKPLLIMQSIWNRDRIIDFKNFLINYNATRIGFSISSIFFGLSRNED